MKRATRRCAFVMLQGYLFVSCGLGFTVTSEVGARTDDIVPLMAGLRQLSSLTFTT